ncbi:terminase gpA endonuclease subunit [Rubinisphaera margarita]|uniref:terminase gpA endonuclease subunit n=1 Tax=Rubinisphaera margarita TaxID=2909586 RepID=UPI001EE812AA|nr:terminase gpA endonuclease subunit [Rubinisphaera margarita]MCG6156349.1 phage terminase large subunit family protein [Rubinisphaera margarita]
MLWTENDCRQANVDSQLVHEGQRSRQRDLSPAPPKKLKHSASAGRGATQISSRWEQSSSSRRSRLRGVGEGYSGNDLLDHGVTLLEVNADHWKSWVHQRLTTPLSQPGAMRLFQAAPHEHLSLTKHLTAERKIEEFVAGKGMVTRGERIRKNNHWFDALYNACAAGHAVGVRLFEAERLRPQPRRKLSEVGEEKRRNRQFVDPERWQGIRKSR